MGWNGVPVLKILFLIVISITSLFSSNILKLQAEILSSIAHTLIHKKYIKVCVNDKKLAGVSKYCKTLKFVSCSKADIVFTSKDDNISKKCKTNLIFSTSYYSYEHSPMVVGAFFWQKGRPNIIFRKKKLEHLSIKLPKEFQKYIE